MSATSYSLIDYTDKSYAIEGDIFKTLKLSHGSRSQKIKVGKTGESVHGVIFPKANLGDITNILKTNNIDLVVPDHLTVSAEKQSVKKSKDEEETPKPRKTRSKKEEFHKELHNDTQEEMTEEMEENLKNSDYDDNVWGHPKKRLAKLMTSEKYNESAFKKLRSIAVQQETNNLSIDGLVVYQYEGRLYNVFECKYNCKNREPDPIYIIYCDRFACAIRFSLHDDYEKEDSMNKSAMDSYRKSEMRYQVRFPDYCDKNVAYIYYIIDKMSKRYFTPHRLYVSDPKNDDKKNYSFVNIISTLITDDQEIPKNQEGIYNWIFGMMDKRVCFFDIITSVLVNIGTKK